MPRRTELNRGFPGNLEIMTDPRGRRSSYEQLDLDVTDEFFALQFTPTWD